MKPAVRSLLTSSSMTFCLSGAKDLFFCFTGLTFDSIFSQWIIIFEGMPGISVADQAKISVFALSRFISYRCSRSGSCDPIWTVFLRFSSFNEMKISCLIDLSLSSFFLWSNLSTNKESSD